VHLRWPDTYLGRRLTIGVGSPRFDDLLADPALLRND
jgi:hypothetical protein